MLSVSRSSLDCVSGRLYKRLIYVIALQEWVGYMIPVPSHSSTAIPIPVPNATVISIHIIRNSSVQ